MNGQTKSSSSNDENQLLSKASVRRAKPSDYSAVTEGIGDVYNGRDWLPDKYHEFLDDTDVSAFVIEIPDHGVVGFYLAQYLDGGRTLIKRAGRIHPDFRNLGLFRRLGGFLIQDAEERGTVEREMMVALEATAPRVRKLDYHLKNTMYFYLVDILVSELTPVHSTEYDNVFRMSTSDMDLFFDTPELWKKLIPAGFLWVESIPLRRYKENIRKLMNHRTTCLMTFDRESNKSDENVDMKNEHGERNSLTESTMKKLSMISVGHHFHVKTGVAYNINFFSDNFTVSDLCSHVKYHIHNLKSFGKNRVHFMVTVNPHKMEETDGKLKGILGKLGIYLDRDGVRNSDSLFEKTYS